MSTPNLHGSSDDWNKLKHLVELSAENARLKAEVERLKKFSDEALAHIAKEERKSRERLDMVQSEVELLRKAGDALAKTIGENGVSNKGSFHDVADSIDRWYAAKEGKQP